MSRACVEKLELPLAPRQECRVGACPCAVEGVSIKPGCNREKMYR